MRGTAAESLGMGCLHPKEEEFGPWDVYFQNVDVVVRLGRLEIGLYRSDPIATHTAHKFECSLTPQIRLEVPSVCVPVLVCRLFVFSS